MHFSEKVYNLEKATEQLELPLVVKSENVSQETTCSNRSLENTSRLPPDSISLLERKINISFAGLTVLGFGESNKADDVDEIYFFMYHSEVEDENYLFPLTYTGKCRLIHPPARSKRYVAVTEVIVLFLIPNQAHHVLASTLPCVNAICFIRLKIIIR